MMDKAALELVFPSFFAFFLLIIIPPLFRTHLPPTSEKSVSPG
jgi:hypothetical protein